MKRIAIDVDDVIIDLVPAWIAEYNRQTGEDVKVEELTDWDLAKFVNNPRYFYSLLMSDTLYTNARPVEGASAGIWTLQKAGIEVVLVTAYTCQGKVDWLYTNGYIDSKFPFSDNYVVARNKSLINADMIIDDKAETVISYPNGGIIFAKPWNDIKLWPVNVERLDGWQAILKYLGLGE